MIVNRATMADILSVSLPTFDTWVKRGCPVLQKGGRGIDYQFDTAAVFRWDFIQVLEEKIAKTSCGYAEGCRMKKAGIEAWDRELI